jgi:hypothetical protein
VGQGPSKVCCWHYKGFVVCVLCLVLFRWIYTHFLGLQYSIGCSKAPCWVVMHVMSAGSNTCRTPHDSIMLSQHILFHVHL